MVSACAGDCRQGTWKGEGVLCPCAMETVSTAPDSVPRSGSLFDIYWEGIRGGNEPRGRPGQTAMRQEGLRGQTMLGLADQGKTFQLHLRFRGDG